MTFDGCSDWTPRLTFEIKIRDSVFVAEIHLRKAATLRSIVVPLMLQPGIKWLELRFVADEVF